jgi:glycosyltransferase involved in cell wall biosynthesis
LRKTLTAFADLRGCDQAEIVLVDNNSSDGTRAVVEECRAILGSIIPLTYVFEPHQGIAIARNTGVDAARGDIIAFLDDDAIPSRQWLTGMIDLFASRADVMAAGGPVEPNFETARPDWLTHDMEGPYSILDLGNKIREFPSGHWPFGASMAFRASALRQHRFPENLGRKGNLLLSNEETHVLRKIKAAGGRIFYLPEMHVRHFVSKARLNKEWIKKRYYYGGLSKAFGMEGKAALIGLFAITVLKRLYLLAMSTLLLGRTRLVDECRWESCKGAFHGVAQRWQSGVS